MKILIITGKFGSGHISAAWSLAAKISRKQPQAEIVIADIYDIAFPGYGENIYKTYTALMKGKGAKLINLAYRKAVHAEKEPLEAVSSIENHLLRRLGNYIEQTVPAAVITTYSLAARLVSDYLRRSGRNIPLVTCITDVTIHNVWLNHNTDFYLAAAEETRQSLLAYGVGEEKIAVSGIPVGERYCPNQAQKRQDGMRELLIMGGGLGMLPLADEFYRGLSQMHKVHTTVITGKNYKLRERLDSAGYPGLEVVGYTDRVYEYMQRADLLMTKPGGITTFEALHCRLPLLVIKPFLEQEIKNAEFIAAHGLGVVLEQAPEQSLPLLETLIKSEPLLAMMRAAQEQQCAALREDAVVDYLRGLGEAERRQPA